MKYVALMAVRPLNGNCQSLISKQQFYRSPFLDNKDDAELWLENKKKEFPNHCVNTMVNNRDYCIHYTIIAFDERESENVSNFVKYCISRM